MNLTPLQRRVLRLYTVWRENPPTVGSLFALNWKRHLLMAVVLTAMCGIMTYLGNTDVSYWIVGVLVGALARDLGFFLRTVKIWPLEAALLDWRRVDEL